jgi:hypothetical protein
VPRIRAPAPGTLPDRFELIAPLGAGGMGDVFLVLDREQGTELALKLLARPGGGGATPLRKH